MFSALGSFISCMFYIVSTYIDNGISFLEYIDIAIMCVYLLEYLLRLFAAQHRFQFVFSVWSLVDLATILPIFFISQRDDADYLSKIVNISRIVRFLRVVKVINKYYTVNQVYFLNIIRLGTTNSQVSKDKYIL